MCLIWEKRHQKIVSSLNEYILHPKVEMRCLLMIFLYSWQLRTILFCSFTKYLLAMLASQTLIYLKNVGLARLLPFYWNHHGDGQTQPMGFQPSNTEFMCGLVRELSLQLHLLPSPLWEPMGTRGLHTDLFSWWASGVPLYFLDLRCLRWQPPVTSGCLYLNKN